MASICILYPEVLIDGKPRRFLRDWTGADFPASVLLPPLDQIQTAAYLRAHGHRVTVLDTAAEGIAVHDIPLCVSRQGADFVAITTGWESLQADVALLKEIKRLQPGVKSILSGPLVTPHPELGLEHDVVDFVTLGYAEDPYLRLLDGDRSQNVTYRENGTIKLTPRQTLRELDSLPYPARDLIPVSSYKAPFLRRNPFTTATMSRGCSHPHCHFCPIPTYYSKRAAFRSAEHVLGELEEIVFKYGIHQVLFRDETFTGNKHLVRQVCEGILERRLDLSWRATTRTDLVTPELLTLMARAGCHQISYGIETHNERTLALNEKKATQQIHFDAVRWAKEAGLEVTGLFMLGMEGDSEIDARQILPYAKKLGVDYAEFNITAIVPGTKYAEYLAPRIPGPSPRGDSLLYNTTAIPLRRLRWLQRRANLGFYFRPSVIWKHLKRVRHFEDLLLLAKTAKSVVFS